MEEHEAAKKLVLANTKRERLGTWSSELSSSVRGKKGERAFRACYVAPLN